MTGKLLQAIGVATILGLLGGAFAGFAVLKDRVRIVIQDDGADTGPDATALLRDDVQVIAGDLRTLQGALGTNFERLASGLEEAASARHEDVLALRREVAGSAAEVQRLRQQMAAVEAQVAALQQQVAAAPTAGAMAPGDGPGTQPVAVATEPAAKPVAEPPVETPVEPPVVAPVAPAAAKPKSTGFLSFQLPSSGFAFDAEQRYVLLPELCRVGFDAKSTLHDFTGVTSKVRGAFRADWDDAKGLCVGEILVDAASLRTGVDGRDDNMREHLDTGHHPEIRFAITRFVPGTVDVAARTAKGEVLGTMTIRGKSRELQMPVAIEVDAQQRVVITGDVPLLLSDYEVPVPSQLGLINMQDEVKVWVALRARAQGAAK